MGTNYYVKINCCDKCNRYDQLHIGKSSAGWKFSFRGYRDHSPPLTSEQSWRDFLKDKKIENEYGETVPYDEFWSNAISEERKKLRDHIDYLKNSPVQCDREYVKRHLNAQNAWHDENGNSFLAEEFS